MALLMAVVIGIPLGLYAGLKPEAWSSKTIMAGSILGFSLPTFWVGIMMIMVFAVMLGWLPSTGRGETVAVFGIDVSFLTWDGLRHLFLPALQPGAPQDFAGDPPDPRRHARGGASGLH